jgi:hypothetical protein
MPVQVGKFGLPVAPRFWLDRVTKVLGVGVAVEVAGNEEKSDDATSGYRHGIQTYPMSINQVIGTDGPRAPKRGTPKFGPWAKAP